MAYDITTGILTVDPENETFDTMLDNIAKAIKDYRVTEVSGVLARDLGMLCTSPNINKWSKHKPIRSESISEISETDIINANFGFTPTQIDIFTPAGTYSNYTIYKLNGDTSLWTYNVPRGKSNEYTEWFRVKDFNGYKSKAKNFLSSPMSSENNLSQTHSIFTPNYKFDESSANNSGSYADIDIMLSKLNFKVVDSQMPNIGESSIYTYRIALAIKVKFVSGTNLIDGYLIASSIKPLGQVETSESEMVKYKVDLANVSDILKMIARQQENNTFSCVPFIAYDLKYSDDKHFYWGGTVNQKAFPFPNNDRCQLKLTGFPYKVIGSVKSFSIKINGTIFTPSNYVVENGSLYWILTNIPKTVNTVQLTISYAITSGFGVMSNWEMGLTGYYQATPNIINESGSEWVDEEKIYTFTTNDTNAPSGLTTAASNQMQYLDTPINLRYTNSQKLGTQYAIEPNKVMIRFVFVK